MRRLGILVWLLVAIVLASGRITRGAAVSGDDMATLRGNVVRWYTRGTPAPDTIEKYMRTLRSDGSWPDVDYANAERGKWATYQHLARMFAMAQAYRQGGHELAGDADLRSAIEAALAHWMERDYQNPNWWYTRIGVPKTLAPILILMGDDLAPELAEKATRRDLGRSRMGMTGQNKVWVAGIAFLKGMLTEDAELMTEAREQILEELCITTAEGVQPDYSFHQHGPQLQWGNYGLSFGADMIQWASIFHGTSYAVDPASLRILGDYLAEGQAWIVWHGGMDISACGRQIFRGSRGDKGHAVLSQLRWMVDLDSARAQAYRQALAANQPGAANTLIGHKHFWRSDISVHRRPAWYASVKMSSTRVVGAETCNSENMLGLHLGDGVTYFLRTGAEYDDLFPVWDWQRLPGMTCSQRDTRLTPSSKRCRGRSDFVGGVSAGDCGVAAMEYLRDGLRARKAWFFLDEAVVCLGADICADDPDPVFTSLEQCAFEGPITISTGRQVRQVARGASVAETLKWAHHNGIGYVFLEPQAVTVQGMAQTGDWYRVHHRESRRAVERDVFSLWIEHGVEPNGARYAYAVLPNVTVDDLRTAEEVWPVSVLAQTASLLAISSEGGKRVQAAFFEPGKLAWDGSSIEVDAPCLVLLDRTVTPARLYVADPMQRRQALNLRVSGAALAELTLELPVGDQAGRTVSVELRP